MLIVDVRIVMRETGARKWFRVEPLLFACAFPTPELGIPMKQPYAKPVLLRRGLLSPITALTSVKS
jgi:hypothetical protein